MPDTDFVVHFKQSSGNVSAVVLRNPTITTLNDNDTATQPRLTIPYFTDQGQTEVKTNITAASNAIPIVLTVDSITGFTDGDVVKVAGVGGNTAANGTFHISSVAGSNITLDLSDGNAAYTSGGTITKLFKAPSYHIAATAALVAIFNDKSLGN